MNPGYGTALFMTALVASILIRVPHDRRSAATRVAESRKGAREVALLLLMTLAVMVLPLLHTATRLLSFADHPLPPWAFAAGALVVPLWLWLFHRAHADLGTNWSVSLEVRTDHTLITRGVYARLRHPMYTAIYLSAVAQALLLANWVAGPATLAAFTLMFALRVGPEERMMRERFGAAYDEYAQRTQRLIPGVW